MACYPTEGCEGGCGLGGTVIGELSGLIGSHWINLPRATALTGRNSQPPGSFGHGSGKARVDREGGGDLSDDYRPGDNLVGKHLPAPGLRLVERLPGRGNARDITIRLTRIASYVVDGVRTYKDLAHGGLVAFNGRTSDFNACLKVKHDKKQVTGLARALSIVGIKVSRLVVDGNSG